MNAQTKTRIEELEKEIEKRIKDYSNFSDKFDKIDKTQWNFKAVKNRLWKEEGYDLSMKRSEIPELQAELKGLKEGIEIGKNEKLMHFFIIKDRDMKYLCNEACSISKDKVTNDYFKVTCKNCKEALIRDRINIAVSNKLAEVETMIDERMNLLEKAGLMLIGDSYHPAYKELMEFKQKLHSLQNHTGQDITKPCASREDERNLSNSFDNKDKKSCLDKNHSQNEQNKKHLAFAETNTSSGGSDPRKRTEGK